MRSSFLGLILTAGVVLGLSPTVSAQTTQSSGTTQAIPDLSGIWERRGMGPRPEPGLGSDGAPEFGLLKEAPPMLPWAKQKYDAVRNGVLRNPYDKALDAFDPGQSCFPHGPTRLFTNPRPFEIRQLPGMVFFLFEFDHWVRRIYLDGRGHPDGYPITWMGHSIGRYEGDALVADTTLLNDKTWLDALGHPHSDALRVEERFRRPDHNTLQIDFVFDDPKAYTKPWTGKKIYELMPPGFEVMEDYTCDDRLQLGVQR